MPKPPRSAPTNAFDTDGGGVGDGDEWANGKNPLDPADDNGAATGGDNQGGGDQGVDTDGDGLSDADEAAFGTNPNAADSDGDGVNDPTNSSTAPTRSTRIASSTVVNDGRLSTEAPVFSLGRSLGPLAPAQSNKPPIACDSELSNSVPAEIPLRYQQSGHVLRP